LSAAVVGQALEGLVSAGTLLLGEFRPGGAEREWCDPEVLRLLRRRSLARLRREVEPVDPAALARFLPAWHGIAPLGTNPPPLRGTAALERLAEVVDQLAGQAIPASVLERDVLPARLPGYLPRLLDELGALGEVAWVGRGSLGRDDGRIALVRPGRELLRPTGLPDGSERPEGSRHDAIREHLARRGASFYRELFAAAGGGKDREVLDALWDLVWAGEVTNDTFAPLRALRWKRSGSSTARRPVRPGRLTSLGPPEAAGRWSLVSADLAEATPTQRLHALSLALLERHGVLTREAVAAEGIDGGFSAVYPVLRAMEDAGRIRRGYFVDGLGAAQFAHAGALDRLRAVREPADPPARGEVQLLAAADPANPYGAALAWPRRDEADRRPYQRAAGAYVVLVDGIAVLYLERGGATLQALPAAADTDLAIVAAAALRALVADGRLRELVIRKVDGDDVSVSPFRPVLLEAGFVAGYRGLLLRADRPGSAGTTGRPAVRSADR
jgi:ATP-dependent Lhr-like helicase